MATITHTLLIWAALAKELQLMGLGLFGRDCPISLLIAKEISERTGREIETIIAGKDLYNEEAFDIEFGEKQTGIVRWVFEQRIKPFESLAE